MYKLFLMKEIEKKTNEEIERELKQNNDDPFSKMLVNIWVKNMLYIDIKYHYRKNILLKKIYKSVIFRDLSCI